jgi:signal transduction histidine kinase
MTEMREMDIRISVQRIRRKGRGEALKQSFEQRMRDGAGGVPVSAHGSPGINALVASLQRRNEALSSALARAHRAEQARLAFLAMVSHELRTPLSAVTGFSDAALRAVRGPLPEPYREYFAAIRGVGEHLQSLADDLLDLTRLEVGSFALEPGIIAAERLVAEARAMVTSTAERDGINIAAVALAGEWLLRVDPMRARQILVNLLANAVKFTPRDGAVGIDAAPIAGQFLAITVWDTGIGIAIEEQERIFDAFHQAPDRAARRGDKGVGLGLAIARQLARAMGGEITVSSVPGKGSRFTVRLPLESTSLPTAA